MEKRARYSEYQSELASRRWNKDAKASTNDKPNDKPKEYLHAVNEDVNVKSYNTIETNSPNRLFSQDNPNFEDNSLIDLYHDDSNYSNYLKNLGEGIKNKETDQLDDLYQDLN
jgi:hypothetical protein